MNCLPFIVKGSVNKCLKAVQSWISNIFSSGALTNAWWYNDIQRWTVFMLFPAGWNSIEHTLCREWKLNWIIFSNEDVLQLPFSPDCVQACDKSSPRAFTSSSASCVPYVLSRICFTRSSCLYDDKSDFFCWTQVMSQHNLVHCYKICFKLADSRAEHSIGKSKRLPLWATRMTWSKVSSRLENSSYASLDAPDSTSFPKWKSLPRTIQSLVEHSMQLADLAECIYRNINNVQCLGYMLQSGWHLDSLVHKLK